MEAIVLAGGFGTRLSKIVRDVPKPMALIGERPFLEILLSSLARNGFVRVILSVGYKAEVIQNYFGGHFNGMKLIYSKEITPLGTGGGLRLAMSNMVGDQVFVFNGDTFIDFKKQQVRYLWKFFSRPTIIGHFVSDTSRYGRLLEENGVAKGFAEKGVSGPGLINAGCYLLKSEQLDEFLIGEHFSLEKDFLIFLAFLQIFSL